jgi:hypothetical protein
MQLPIPLRVLARGIYARFRYLTLSDHIFTLTRQGKFDEAYRLDRHRKRMHDIIFPAK